MPERQSSADRVVQLYCCGHSIPQVSELTGLARSTVRHHVRKAGFLRSREEGVRLAAKEGRLGAGFRGKNRAFTAEHCANIAMGKTRSANAGNAVGVSLKPNGYVEFTRGPDKGRCVHVVLMEKRLGRRLMPDECVHHIDGDKTNNQDNNLALVTKSGHMRLHRHEDKISGQERQRKSDGRFC